MRVAILGILYFYTNESIASRNGKHKVWWGLCTRTIMLPKRYSSPKILLYHIVYSTPQDVNTFWCKICSRFCINIFNIDAITYRFETNFYTKHMSLKWAVTWNCQFCQILKKLSFKIKTYQHLNFASDHRKFCHLSYMHWKNRNVLQITINIVFHR